MAHKKKGKFPFIMLKTIEVLYVNIICRKINKKKQRHSVYFVEINGNFVSWEEKKRIKKSWNLV